MPRIKFGPDSIGGIVPGQASQEQGMGIEAFEETEAGKRIYEIGSTITGEDLYAYCKNTKTEDMTGWIVQPALGAAHLSAVELSRSRGFIADFWMGQSISEIIVLAAAGAISVEDMFRILKVRGEAMEEAFQNNPSIMSAVIGPVEEHVAFFVQAAQKRLEKLGLPGVYQAMGNSYRQNVVSAHPEAMRVFRELVEYIQSLGGAAQKLLGVELHRTDIKDVKDDGGSHSPYMSDGVQEVFDVVDSVPKQMPQKPVIANNGKLLYRPAVYAPYLAGQLEHPAQWYRSIWVAIDLGARAFAEIEGGSKRILVKNMRHDFPDNSILKEEFGRVIRINSVPEEHRPKDLKEAA